MSKSNKFITTTKEIMDSIRKPMPPPTRVFDPKRKNERKDIKAGRSKNWHKFAESKKENI